MKAPKGECSNTIKLKIGLPWWLRLGGVCLQCGRFTFHPWVGKIPGEGNSNLFQYSCLENPMDGGAWQAI